MTTRSSLRPQKLLDYKESSLQSGKRVYKGVRNVGNMSGPKIQDSEKKICMKIKRFLEENEISEFFDIDEIENSAGLLRELLETYEDVHIALESELGDRYAESYKDYDENVEKISKWLKESKAEVRRRKAQVLDREKEKLRVEEEFFRSRIARDLESLDLEKSVFVDDLERHTSVAKDLIRSYSDIFLKIKEHSLEFAKELQETYDEQIRELEKFVQERRKMITILKLEEKKFESDRRESDEQRKLEEKKIRDDEIVLVCKNIHENICERMKKLESKCKIKIESQTDVQIMELKKDFKSVDAEYSAILDKILKLAESNPSRYEETKNLPSAVSKRKDNLCVSIEKYKTGIDSEISKRDLTEEKIKNAATLGIKLPKFKGYNSTLDYYTFKSEFEKLVSKRISKDLLSDYLKLNYLEGQALQLVKEIDDLGKIWERLKSAYGNVSTLLTNKIEVLDKTTPLWKVKGDEKVVESIIKLKNVMMELSTLSGKHSVEHCLYHTSNIAKVYAVLGRDRQLEFTKNLYDNDSESETELSDKQIWEALIKFLEKELKIKEKIILLNVSTPKPEEVKSKPRNDDSTKHFPALPAAGVAVSKPCSLCGKSDHATTVTKKGHKIVCYHSCESFATMTVKERFVLLKSKNLCYQCLAPGFKLGHKGRCFDAYKCPDPSHNGFRSGLHVLVCDTHKGNPENLQLLEKYKAKCIGDGPTVPKFSLDISLHVNEISILASGESGDDAIFMFQCIAICEFRLNLFYDGGCSDLVLSKRALDIFMQLGRAKLVQEGPILLRGVGDVKSVCPYGRFQISIPLHNGREASLTGICLDKVTSTFDGFSLKAAEQDLREHYVRDGGDPKNLPKLLEFVGGDTDVMIGIKNNKYFPRELFRMESGLAIYESQFVSVDGSRGICAGPHKSFNRPEGSANHVYLTEAALIYSQMQQLDLEIGSVEDISDDEDIECETLCEQILPLAESEYDEEMSYVASPNCLRKFETVERAGTEASYRCVRCRGCEQCKKSGEVESTSIRDEVEQALVEKTVVLNPETRSAEARLPFLCDPEKRLVSNYGRAKKFYVNQVKTLSSKPSDRERIIAAMKKLFTLGYATKFEDLTEQQRSRIETSPVKYYIPWIVAWSKNSLTTPVRPVFNASSPTASGYSLNDLLAKGSNNMNKLIQIMVRWLVYACAFVTDVQKMYNTVKLAEKHWCYQLFLWNDELDPSREPQVCVINTLIYGVKSSGNQAEYALRATADLFKDEYPAQNRMIQEDTYVDDCPSGVTVLEAEGVNVEASLEEAKTLTDGMQVMMDKTGFVYKGVIFSGCDPPENLCNEDQSVTVGGLKWFPKADLLSLNINELNFGKKSHGKKAENSVGVIPSKLKRKQCASRVGEIFDLTGRFAPLIAEFKLDLHDFCDLKIQWNEFIPDELFQKWKTNFSTMEEMREIKFQRCVVPVDAVSLDMEILGFGDSSAKMACCAIYVRFKRKSGSYSCQLVMAKTKIIPSDTSLPRAELIAGTLNATTGHVVDLSLSKFVVGRVNFTDNQVALYWISSSFANLKQWVRGQVVEINRLTEKENWFYIKSKDNTADLGTRRGAKISDVLDGTPWVNGPEWATEDRENFPVKSVQSIRLGAEELKDFNDELVDPNIHDNEWIAKQLETDFVHVNDQGKDNLAEVSKRYQYSTYVIDPNRFSFRKVVRIVGLVFKFVSKLKRKIGKSATVVPENPIPSRFQVRDKKFLVTSYNKFPFNCKQGLVVELTDNDVLLSLDYFFKKATAEVKQFARKKSYKDLSRERLGILFYTGRILPSQKIDSKVQLSDVCLDLTQDSFCVPLIEKHSPLAYAFINEIHWFDPDASHSGVETLWRHVLKNVYILEGKTLVKDFKDQCVRCRYLRKRAIDVAMGPKAQENLCVAPPFFNSQVDICGPYNSYHNVNKRATSKIWFVVFCCCVTGAVDLKVAEDYSTSSFVLAFLRFACKVGFPRKLMPDAGSQLIKGCEDMTVSFYDIHNNLSEFGVDFQPCPVGAHYMHGKVERKIKDIKLTFEKHLQNHRLSLLQWETLGAQVANSLNNLPIGIGNVARDLENLDLITPNRLLMGRNNSRCPSEKMIVSSDLGRILEQNDEIFEVWFRAWLTSCVPNLMLHPKWFKSDSDPQIGDVVLFLKSDKEFERLYQYGIICDMKKSRDGKIRELEIEYQNFSENVKRRTTRGTREIVVIHPLDELGLIRKLNIMAAEFI